MEGFLRALCEYAQDQRVTPYLETWEYRRATYDLEEDWTAFRSTLTAEQARILDALLNRERNAACLEDQAIFSCGLSMGVGLGRF
ncbi:hypothetical protein [uncultured Oscillibacter sp.]|uniref:hypothetical protein n=1 Tax=uncultured Oscillibacter sp. TaxID=876091 RepID=UPI002631AB23|nr:hypothetical protein [uncultured Oscillibacter sp.]